MTKEVSVKNIGFTSDRTTVQAFWVTSFAVLTAISAQIEIPHAPVPFTLQTFLVLLSGALLGWRNGFFSMSLYLGLGLVGLPVFSSGGFGVMKLLGPTGGYLLAFPIAAFLIGYGLHLRSTIPWTVVWMLLGLTVIFAFGTLQLSLTTGISFGDAFENGFLIFSWWDLTKLVAATAITLEVNRRRAKTH